MLSTLLLSTLVLMISCLLSVAVITVTAHPAFADQKIADKYPNNQLYDKPQKVIDGVWSAIGQTAPGSFENGGHNNNLSFIITNEGIVVINAGASYLLAKALHAEIKKLSDKPVKYVILENGQGHAMLGSNYWKEQGVPIIAHKDAAEVIEKEGLDRLERMKGYNRENAKGTKVVAPDKTFDKKFVIKLGGWVIEALYLGPAHGPGDTVVWLPQKKLVISGDMAFHRRLLPIFEDTDTAAWLETWEKFAALDAQIVIPGHGEPTNMAEVTKYTKGYLTYLRNKVRAHIDSGGDDIAASHIDQSPYAHLDTFQDLAGRNAARVFTMMEFE